MNTAELLPAPKAIAPRLSLVQKFAAKFSIEPDKLLKILKATCFKVKDAEVSDEQMAALLVVADQHGLNPFTREIFAFPDKQNGIVPVVSVDGWSRIINEHPQADGMEFRYSEFIKEMPHGRRCPEWCEVVIYRKDRGHPTVVREYLEECYRLPTTRKDGSLALGPWQSHTKRLMRHKTLIQGSRVAFGFSGIYDEDEAARVIEANAVLVEDAPVSGTAALRAAAEKARQTPPDGLGATQEPEATVVPAETGTPEDGNEAPADGWEPSLDSRVADYAALLDEATSVQELDDLAKGAPEDVRADATYLAAFEKRCAALLKAKK